MVAAATSSAGPSKKSSNVDERCKFTGRQLFEQRGSALILEDAGGEGDADEDDEDFMTMRTQDDDQEEGDAAGGEGDEELLGGIGDQDLFDEDEDLPDE